MGIDIMLKNFSFMLLMSGSLLEVSLSSREHLIASGDMLDCCILSWGLLRASSAKKPGMPPSSFYKAQDSCHNNVIL